MTNYSPSLIIAAMEALTSFPARLRWAREKAKLTQPQLAKLCGWESQSRISHYERGRRQPVPSDLRAISDALKTHGVNAPPAWLQWGDGPISVNEGTTLGQVAREYNLEPGPDIAGMVPLISLIQAGKFAEIHDPYPPGHAEEYMPYPKRGSQHIVAARVKGDSMTAPYGKSYPNGSIIFINLEMRTPSSGQRVVAKLEHEEEATFKVYVEDAGRKWLKPLNPQHPPILDPFRIVGTVVGKWEDE